MVLAASIAALGLSAGSVLVLGQGLTADFLDAISVVGVVSAFVTICAAEAHLAS